MVNMVFAGALGLIMATVLVKSTALITPLTPESIIALKRATSLTNRANADPSYASDACTLWSSILTNTENGTSSLPPDVLSAAHALYASALVRIGRDKDAIVQYQTSIDYLDSCSTDARLSNTELDIRMGLGKSFQRLFRYSLAKSAFHYIVSRCSVAEVLHSSYTEALQRTVICSMRLGDGNAAIDLIRDFEMSTKRGALDHDIIGMKGALLLLYSATGKSKAEACRLLKCAFKITDSILYKWLYIVTLQTHTAPHDFPGVNDRNKNKLHQYAEINNSAFDDPSLLYLDDKLLLHSVLKSTENAEQFYPQSLIIPKEIHLLEDSFSKEDRLMKQKWILKERSGYGSHGNRVVSATDLAELYSPQLEPVLCQRIVDPPMLLNGCRFSLRIYVVYFPKGLSLSREKTKLEAEIFLSGDGLVKLASSELDSESILENQLMTNSGRGDGRSNLQYDLQYLRSIMEKEDINSYNDLWKRIQNAIYQTMSEYTTLRYNQSPSLNNDDHSLEISTEIPINCEVPVFSCIPKILGFDFMLDAFGNPWLLEVNRFPGLEPRSSMDAATKSNLIYDAWLVAADRAGLDRKVLHDIRPQCYKSFSLVKLFKTE